MIDTHAHLNLREFDGDRNEVIDVCQELNIEVINVGIDYLSSVKAIEIAEEREGFYASAGIHPNTREKIEIIEPLLAKEKVVAVGETGLDFLRIENDKTEQERQRLLMIQHGELARKHDLPLIIHCRKAYADLLFLLRRDLSDQTGVIHCFSGSLSNARELLNMGYYLGFNGLIFKLNLDEIIESTPLERILTETDSPFLPPPFSNDSRNSPHLGLKPVLEKIAFLKKVPVSEVESITVQNAHSLFKLNNHGKIPTS